MQQDRHEPMMNNEAAVDEQVDHGSAPHRSSSDWRFVAFMSNDTNRGDIQRRTGLYLGHFESAPRPDSLDLAVYVTIARSVVVRISRKAALGEEEVKNRSCLLLR